VKVIPLNYNNFVFISVEVSGFLEDPGVDFMLNFTLLKIYREITADDLIEMKYLLHGNYLF
jgi:hypothetical protein